MEREPRIGDKVKFHLSYYGTGTIVNIDPKERCPYTCQFTGTPETPGGVDKWQREGFDVLEEEGYLIQRELYWLNLK